MLSEGNKPVPGNRDSRETERGQGDRPSSPVPLPVRERARPAVVPGKRWEMEQLEKPAAADFAVAPHDPAWLEVGNVSICTRCGFVALGEPVQS